MKSFDYLHQCTSMFVLFRLFLLQDLDDSNLGCYFIWVKTLIHIILMSVSGLNVIMLLSVTFCMFIRIAMFVLYEYMALMFTMKLNQKSVFIHKQSLNGIISKHVSLFSCLFGQKMATISSYIFFNSLNSFMVLPHVYSLLCIVTSLVDLLLKKLLLLGTFMVLFF